MLELHRYFPAILLDLTWELESQLEVQRARDQHHKVTVRANGPLAFKLINNSEFPERETSSTLIMYKSLGLFQKKGPVIVRPARKPVPGAPGHRDQAADQRVQNALSDHGDRVA